MRTLAEWLELQDSIHPRSIDLGLERVTEVAQRLGVTAPAFRVLTVGGTNGKGSVAAHAEALLMAVGTPVGLFTSPHLIRYNERIRVGGAEALDAELIEAFERIEAARGGTTLTFFEYNTLAALLIFTRRAVEVAVLEVGLGGRLDATNLVAADVAVIASVGLDHREWLGESLEAIGAEKAGILRAGRTAVLGTADMPASVFARIAALGARALVAGREFTWSVAGERWSYRAEGLALEDLDPSHLAGSIQYRNAATAITAVAALAGEGPLIRPLDRRAVNAALGGVRLAGRFEIVPGAVEWILDIAHNEPAARVLAGHLSERALPTGTVAGRGRTLAVVGVLADKDAAGIAAALAPRVDHWVLCGLAGPRGGSGAALGARMQIPQERLTLADSVVEGCERARALARPGDRVVVFGSFHTVGPAREWLRI